MKKLQLEIKGKTDHLQTYVATKQVNNTVILRI